MPTQPKAQSPKPAASQSRLTAAQQKVAQLRAEKERATRELKAAEVRVCEEHDSKQGKRKQAQGNPNWVKGKSANPNGRQPGLKNKLTALKLRLMASTGMTPLEFLTAVYRDQLYDDYDVNVIDEKRMVVELLPKCDPKTGELTAKKVELKIEHRIAAATSAAPYVHRKMPIGIDGGEGKPLAVVTADKLATMTNAELDSMFAVLDRLGIGASIDGGEQKPYRLTD
jgi:hypothetical protein